MCLLALLEKKAPLDYRHSTTTAENGDHVFGKGYTGVKIVKT